MICEPSLFPTFIKPIEETRQDDQPSVNFFEPINRLIGESSSLIFLNKELEKSRSPPRTPLSTARLYSLLSSPTLITPKSSASPTLQPKSPSAPFRLSR